MVRNEQHYSHGTDSLIGIADTTKNGKKDQNKLRNWKKNGFDPNMFLKSDNNRPSVEVVKIRINYSGDLLVKVSNSIQARRSLDIVDNIKTMERQKSHWYRNGN
jgi:hypothetical protein